MSPQPRQGRAPYKPPIEVVDLGGRTPKHNLDCECAILAAIFSTPKHLDAAQATGLRPDHFYADAHRRIFEAVLELSKVGQGVDLQTVAHWLKERDWLQAIGGIAYLARIIDSTPAIAYVEDYCKIIVDLALVRRTVETCQLAAAEGFGDVGDVREWVDSVEEQLYQLASTDRTNVVEQGYDVFARAFARAMNPDQSGVPTGFVDLDECIGGFHDGELLILAARPGMGKTAFIMNVVTNVVTPVGVVREDGSPVPRYGAIVFSLEMPKEQLAVRMMAADARVNLTKLRKQELDAGSFDRFVLAASTLSQLPIYFDDTSGIGLVELRSKVRKQQRMFDKKDAEGRWIQRIGMVVIDYLQLMKGREDAPSREQEISELSRGLKQLAKDLRVPVIALSQLNRNTETRGSKEKRPQLSDLRESGAIEQDADVVMFIFRPEYYITDKTSAEAQKQRGYAEILVAKQRNGPVGKVPATFIDEYTRFENRARDAWRDDD